MFLPQVKSWVIFVYKDGIYVLPKIRFPKLGKCLNFIKSGTDARAATAASAAPQKAHINFHSWVFVPKTVVNKSLKLEQK